MDIIYGGLTPAAFWAACAVTLLAGYVKGAIGFAMPLIMMSLFTSFMTPEMALAGLILAAVTTNIQQGLRDGLRAAWATTVEYRRMIIAIVIGIAITSPFIEVLPQRLLVAMLGVMVVAFGLMQLSGRKMVLRPEHRNAAEWILGLIGGLYGGVSGIWGPTTVIFLLAIGTAKAESIRVQGVIYLIGAVILFLAHLKSGLLDAVTLPFSAALVVPAFIGMWLGRYTGDRLDAARFRYWTLVLLMLTALNLIRRAIFWG